MLGDCTGQDHLLHSQGISKVYIRFSGCAGGWVGQGGHNKSWEL